MLLNTHREKLETWFRSYAATPAAHRWLSIISFTESSFFPIPPDPFLMAMLFVKENKWWQVALNVTISSVLGGLFGYLIGYLFFGTFGEQILTFYSVEGEFGRVVALFQEHVFLTMFTAAFTPLPYKLFTISAGFASVALLPFILASLLGRAIRFFLLALLMHFLGERVGQLVFRYINFFLALAVVLVIIFLVIHLTS